MKLRQESALQARASSAVLKRIIKLMFIGVQISPVVETEWRIITLTQLETYPIQGVN